MPNYLELVPPGNQLTGNLQSMIQLPVADINEAKSIVMAQLVAHPGYTARFHACTHDAHGMSTEPCSVHLYPFDQVQQVFLPGPG
jgi:hypothetical protein